MFKVDMLEDIKSVEKTLFKHVTMRQAACICIGALYTFPIVYFLPLSIGVKIFIAFFLITPAYFCGNPNLVNHEPLEIFLIRFIYQSILTPKKRCLKSKNTIRESQERLERKEEQKKISKMPPDVKKRYLKKKKQDSITIPSKNPQYKIYR